MPRRKRAIPTLSNEEIHATVDAVTESLHDVDPDQVRALGGEVDGDVPLSFESPESSSIQGARYDPDTRQMFITFLWGASPTTYRYGDIDPHLWEEFVQATSKGSFVSSRIRPMYTGEKVTS